MKAIILYIILYKPLNKKHYVFFGLLLIIIGPIGSATHSRPPRSIVSTHSIPIYYSHKIPS